MKAEIALSDKALPKDLLPLLESADKETAMARIAKAMTVSATPPWAPAQQKLLDASEKRQNQQQLMMNSGAIMGADMGVAYNGAALELRAL